MEDIFKPTSLTIRQLFGNTDALYQVPRYQRPYSWADEELEKLWDDLKEAKTNDPNYFLGSIITAKAEDSGTYLDIVDGQQRLTTMLIMLCVLRDLYPTINKDRMENDPSAIDVNIIKSSIKYNDRFERLRLKTHSNHESDFQEMILKPGTSINHSRPYKKEIKREEDPKFKFRNTACFFTEKFTDLGEEQAGDFLNYLFNQVKIIRIDCLSVTFAIKLFQVLNDRGLDLSNSDLIKSFLIGKIHKKYEDDPELKIQHENQFMDDWKACETISIDTEESLNELFVIYEYYLLAGNPDKSLYDELQKLFENQDSNKVIADFKNFITLFKTELYYKEDPLIYSFWYLRWSMYWRAILLTALHTNYCEYEKLARVLQRYYYLNWIAGNTLTKIKQTSFNIIRLIKEKKSISAIEAEINSSYSDNTIERAIDNLNGEIYFEPWCKPLFFLIEYNQQEDPKFYPMWDRNIHIEHVLPKAFKKRKEWQEFHNDEDIGDWLSSGGNLTLLSGSKNIGASNEGFDAKIHAYDGTGLHRKDDAKVSSFKITQKIVDDYSKSKYAKKWDWDAIQDRWDWFCDQIEQIFGIKIQQEVQES